MLYCCFSRCGSGFYQKEDLMKHMDANSHGCSLGTSFRNQQEALRQEVHDAKTRGRSLELLYQKRLTLNDCCIRLEGTDLAVPAHRNILAISSPVFLAMFESCMREGAGRNGGGESVVTLPKRPIDFCDCEIHKEDIEAFVQHCYIHTIDVNKENATPLLALAHIYQVESLINYLFEALTDDLLSSIDEEKLPALVMLTDAVTEQLPDGGWKLIRNKAVGRLPGPMCLRGIFQLDRSAG